MKHLIQQAAPDFTANAVMPNGKICPLTLSQENKNKYLVLFFYPLDFTFVCPSEIISFSNNIAKFEERNAQVLGVSIDSEYVHHAWRKTPVNSGGIGEITFPLISDINKEISQKYGVLLENGIALRGTFIIDTSGIIRHATLNDLPLGRNVAETLRLLDAIQFNEKHGEVCPAGWNKGDTAIKPDAQGISDYLGKFASKL